MFPFYFCSAAYTVTGFSGTFGLWRRCAIVHVCGAEFVRAD
jgi:hypothetical protein